VAVGVNWMKEALTPFGITRFCRWLVSCRERTVVKYVNIGNSMSPTLKMITGVSIDLGRLFNG
jgi:hypothetical protein